MMRLDLVSKQMQDLLFDIGRVFTDMQEIMVVRCKTGDISSVLKYPLLAFILHMMHIFSYLEMMYLFILADGNWIIIHKY